MNRSPRWRGCRAMAAWQPPFASTLPDPHAVAHAEARTICLATEMGLTRVRPAIWDAIIDDVLGEGVCPLSQAELLAIGRAAAERGAREQAYRASSAGLATAGNPAAIARFLILRTQSLTAPRRSRAPHNASLQRANWAVRRTMPSCLRAFSRRSIVIPPQSVRSHYSKAGKVRATIWSQTSSTTSATHAASPATVPRRMNIWRRR